MICQPVGMYVESEVRYDVGVKDPTMIKIVKYCIDCTKEFHENNKGNWWSISKEGQHYKCKVQIENTPTSSYKDYKLLKIKVLLKTQNSSEIVATVGGKSLCYNATYSDECELDNLMCTLARLLRKEIKFIEDEEMRNKQSELEILRRDIDTIIPNKEE